MARTISLAFGTMFAAEFLTFLGGGFHGLNGFDLAGTGFAAVVFLSQAAWPQAWAFAAQRFAAGQNDKNAPPVTGA